MNALIFENINEHINTINLLYKLDVAVSEFAKFLTKNLIKGGKIMLCGNGGWQQTVNI